MHLCSCPHLSNQTRRMLPFIEGCYSSHFVVPLGCDSPLQIAMIGRTTQYALRKTQPPQALPASPSLDASRGGGPELLRSLTIKQRTSSNDQFVSREAYFAASRFTRDASRNRSRRLKKIISPTCKVKIRNSLWQNNLRKITPFNSVNLAYNSVPIR